MQKSVMLAAVIVAGLATAPAFAATKTYQVTGPVTDMSANTITVQKGVEKWEIAKGSAGVPADVKIGSKVTIMYTMTADSVTSKSAKGTPSSSTATPSSTPKVSSVMPPSAPSAPSVPSAMPPAATPPAGMAMQPAMSTGAGTPTANK